MATLNPQKVVLAESASADNSAMSNAYYLLSNRNIKLKFVQRRGAEVLRDIGYIISMHEKYDDAGKIVAYYYQLQEKIPFYKIQSLSHKSENDKKLKENYGIETTHWLAYWKSDCLMPNISREDLVRKPVRVQYVARSTRYYKIMHDPPLRNFRNINVDDISLFESCEGSYQAEI